MEKENKGQETAPEESITTKQFNLITALYEEIDYPRKYEDTDLCTLSKVGADKHIKAILGWKGALKEAGTPVQNGNGFDKIGFGMVYKLVYKRLASSGNEWTLNKRQFQELLYCEYANYKDATEYAKKKTAEKAVQ